ncbi:inositol monophosphatase [Komagataeibacter nataicola]|uniref:Inositol monophosphatase n=1 Tax=Komagataeibacter nataicola TaxID=265960 RepID=A0A9N7CIA4_9PROT|nr:inositol monophosphatase family protein [Komagataeibacter nataicola]AQU88160.1 inositol monophosphatase [Komagataeibacter nataicola]PYD66037.1 inositol monophosphatase [Komagataeibacter nataicola]WEQ54744.1 inositol monophosphatase [Komagataeibacter nataicola]WNM09101.1 inositol monophosphatase family protein [Komagataeibacter nataicola]GBR20219.1 inositol monophosphatase [Komagataeibacter nataicola NRIC 0616]
MTQRITLADMHKVVAMMREAARRHVMPSFRCLDRADIRSKSGPMDIVTVADEATERDLTAALQAAWPTALVVGEEAVAASPDLLDGLATAELAFVIDPIDGTANYAAGVPLFGVMVSAVSGGEVVGGVIVDPICNVATVAARGHGAWLDDGKGGSRRLQVAPAVPAHEMAGNASWRYLPAPVRDVVTHNLPKVAGSWDFRCAAHEYLMLVDGRCHFLLFNRTLPWDHLAGWLIHQEAGGYSAHFDGSPYRVTDRSGGLLYAPDRASWQALHDLLLTAA